MAAAVPFMFTKQKAPSWASWQVSAIFVYKAESSKLDLVADQRHLCLKQKNQSWTSWQVSAILVLRQNGT
jgi:hypothetical protein